MVIGRDLVFAGLIVILTVASVVTVPAVSAAARSIRVVIGLTVFREGVLEVLSMFGRVDLEIPEVYAVALEVPMVALTHVASLPFVRYVEEDKLLRVDQEVKWNVEAVGATQVWGMSELGDSAYGYHSTVSVAIVDTGIDYTHTDLRGAVTYCVVSLRSGKTFYRGTNLKNCADPNGHGTHVAGVAAARLNGVGVAGVAPKALLYAVRVLDASGSGYMSDVAKGIVEAVKGPDGVPGTDDDADVVSMSLGGPDSQVLYEAVKYAYNYGAVLVAAAGNEGAPAPSCPACYNEVIAVGAVDSGYRVPSWSNRNPDVVAPGVDILSTWPKNRYAYASGTSMACPHVSAAVATMQAARLARGMGKLSPAEVRDLLVATAKDMGGPGYDSLYGHGLLDAYAAVRGALSPG